MAGIKKLMAWWQSLVLPWRTWRIVGQVGAGDEVPDQLPDRGVVLVGESGRATWAAFDCPCRTGHRLMVNLDMARHPFWSVESLKPLSIRPSIDDITPERRCHFFVRRGRIHWASYNRRVTE